MAILLYRYIRNKRVERSAKSQDAGFTNLSQGQESPAQMPETAQDVSLEMHTAGATSSRKIEQGFQGAELAPESTNLQEKSRTEEEKRRMRKYRLKLVVGLFSPFCVQALESTIIAGALPFIASDFDKLGELNWIVSAFNLCSATFIPVWGQLADVFGRYAALQSALLIMVIGSALCAGSPTSAFPMLLVGRALQGMGCAGCNIIVRTCLADKVSLQEQATNNTIFTIVAGTAYGVGPVIGGYLTEASWRWCFVLSCPIGIIGMILAHFTLRHELLGPQPITRTDGIQELDLVPTFRRRLSTIDLGGLLLFIFGMGLVVLGLTWGGADYPWNHVNVLSTLIIGSILVVAFLAYEYLLDPGHTLGAHLPYQKPMVPLNILFTRNAGIIVYINFITGMAMYAAFYFVVLYFTLVLSFTSSKAGTGIIYYLPGLGAGAFAATFLCNVKSRQTWWPLFIGTVIEPLGISLLAFALQLQNTGFIYGMLALTGLGTGIRLMPGSLHGVGYYPKHVASIMSLILLSSALGGTFSTTIMLNIFNNRMSSYGINITGIGQSFNDINSLPEDQLSYFRSKAKESISLAFWAISSFMWLGCLLMAGLGNVYIGRPKGDGEVPENVTKGTYIGSLLKKRKTSAPV